MAFSLNDIDLDPLYYSYQEYLADTTQAPHSPFIIWGNGESTSMKFQIYTGGSDTSIAGSYFIIRDNSGVINRVVKSSLDSSAVGIVHWSDKQIDTLKMYSYSPSGLRSPNQARLIIYNNDTVYNEWERHQNEKYQHFYTYKTIPVILKP